MMEDLSTGEYLTCLCEGFGGSVLKEPGFELHGRPVVGRAVVLSGYEVWCPERRHVLNVHRSLPVEPGPLLEPVRWLSVAEVRAARTVHRAEAEEFARTNAADGDVVVVAGGPAPTPDERSAVCWRCGGGPARKKCARCRCAYYCDAECQSSHWHTHRRTCINF